MFIVDEIAHLGLLAVGSSAAAEDLPDIASCDSWILFASTDRPKKRLKDESCNRILRPTTDATPDRRIVQLLRGADIFGGIILREKRKSSVGMRDNFCLARDNFCLGRDDFCLGKDNF